MSEWDPLTESFDVEQPDPDSREPDCTCGHPGLTYDGPDENCPEHGREHLGYADENGNFEECIEDCPGCHYEGNAGCASWPDCDLCNPDGYGWVIAL